VPKGREILRLVRPGINQDALDAVDKLRDDILKGTTIGFAVVAMHKTSLYTIDVAGECKRHPTLTRGMVAALDDELERILLK